MKQWEIIGFSVRWNPEKQQWEGYEEIWNRLDEGWEPYSVVAVGAQFQGYKMENTYSEGGYYIPHELRYTEFAHFLRREVSDDASSQSGRRQGTLDTGPPAPAAELP